MQTNNQLSSCTLHGVFLDVFGLGVLLTGASGIGKSELAFGLINHGHCLIADDSVELMLHSDGTIKGHCHPILQDFLEIRGLGTLNIRAMFGDEAIKTTQQLHLIINIQTLSDEALSQLDRLHGQHHQQEILQHQFPVVTLPVTPGRNLSVLIEAAVRNHMLKLAGYNASEELIRRQHDFMDQTSELSEQC